MISEPEVKNRYSTPASPIAATIASLASSAWTSVQAPGAIVVATGPPPGYPHDGGEPASVLPRAGAGAAERSGQPLPGPRNPKYSRGVANVKRGAPLARRELAGALDVAAVAPLGLRRHGAQPLPLLQDVHHRLGGRLAQAIHAHDVGVLDDVEIVDALGDSRRGPRLADDHVDDGGLVRGVLRPLVRLDLRRLDSHQVVAEIGR